MSLDFLTTSLIDREAGREVGDEESFPKEFVQCNYSVTTSMKLLFNLGTFFVTTKENLLS